MSSSSTAAADAPVRRLSAFEELVRANNPSRCYRRSDVFLSSRHSDMDPTSAAPSEGFGGGGSPLRKPDPRPSAQSTFIPPPSVLAPQVIASMIDASSTRLNKQNNSTTSTTGQKRPRGVVDEDTIHSSFLLVKDADEEDSSPPLIEATAVLPTTLLQTLLSCDTIINSRRSSECSPSTQPTSTTTSGSRSFTRVELPIQLTLDDFDEAEEKLISDISDGGGGEWSLADACAGRVDGIRRCGIRIEKRFRLVTLRDEAPVAVSIPAEYRGGLGGSSATDAGFIPPTTLMSMVGTKVWCPGEGGFRYGFGCYPFPTPNSDVATFFSATDEKSDVSTIAASQHRVDIQSALTFGRRDCAVPPYHKFVGHQSSSSTSPSSERIQKGNRLYCSALHDNRCARAVLKAIKECEAAEADTNSNNNGTAPSSSSLSSAPLPVFTVDIPVDHPSCSGQHAALYWGLVRTPVSGGLSVEECTWSLELHLQDLGSTHGVMLNGTKMPTTLTTTPSGRLPNGNGLQLYGSGGGPSSTGTSWGSAMGDNGSGGNVVGLLPGDSFKLGTSSREYVVVEDEGPTGSWIQES